MFKSHSTGWANWSDSRVGLNYILPFALSDLGSAWAECKLAEQARKVGKMLYGETSQINVNLWNTLYVLTVHTTVITTWLRVTIEQMSLVPM